MWTISTGTSETSKTLLFQEQYINFADVDDGTVEWTCRVHVYDYIRRPVVLFSVLDKGIISTSPAVRVESNTDVSQMAFKRTR